MLLPDAGLAQAVDDAGNTACLRGEAAEPTSCAASVEFLCRASALGVLLPTFGAARGPLSFTTLAEHEGASQASGFSCVTS